MESDRRQMLKTLVVAGVALALERPKLSLQSPLPAVTPAKGTVALDQEAHA